MPAKPSSHISRPESLHVKSAAERAPKMEQISRVAILITKGLSTLLFFAIGYAVSLMSSPDSCTLLPGFCNFNYILDIGTAIVCAIIIIAALHLEYSLARTVSLVMLVIVGNNIAAFAVFMITSKLM